MLPLFCRHESSAENRLLHFDGAVEVQTLPQVTEEKKLLQTLEKANQQTNAEEIAGQLNAIGEKKDKKEFWHSALESVNADVQQTILSNLKSIGERTNNTVVKKQIENLSKMIEASQKAKKDLEEKAKAEIPQSMLEKASKFLDESSKDFWEGGKMKKAAYIATGVAGFIAARYVWRKLFGNGENEGLVKKGAKWTVSIAGAGLGILAGKSVMDWWNKKTNSPWGLFGAMGAGLWGSLTGKKDKPGDKESQPQNGTGSQEPEGSLLDTAADTLSAGRDIAQGAGKQGFETGKKGIDVAARDLKFWADLFKTNNMNEAMKIIAKEGFTLAYENGKFVVYDITWKAIELPMLSMNKVKDWYMSGEQPEDFWVVWGASGAAYFVGKNALTGNFKSFLPTKGKDIIWTVMKLGSGPTNFFVDGVKFSLIPIQEGGTTAIKLRYLKYNLANKMRTFGREGLVFANWFKNEKMILRDIEQCSQFAKDIKIMKKFGPEVNGFSRLFSEQDIAFAESIQKTIGGRIQNFLKSTTINASTPKLITELKAFENMENVEKFIDVLDKVRSQTLNASRITEAANATAKAAEAATVAKEADAVADVAKAGDEAVEVASKGKYMKGILDRLKIPGTKFMEAMRSAKFPPQIVELFTKTKAGTYFLVETFAKAGAPAMNYLSKLTTILPYAKVAAGPLSIVGLEALCLGLETSSINAEIAKTDSKEIKELLEARKTIAKGSAALGTASGLAISAGSKLALPLLPIWLTYQGASATRKYFETSTIEWMKSDKDMLQETPGALRGKLRSIDPGKQNYAQQNAARKSTFRDSDNILGGSLLEQVTGLGNGEERFKTVETTNRSQRSTLTRAYLVSMSELAPNENETEAQYKERTAKFLLAQEQYMANVTGNTFAITGVDTYYAASEHAELKEIAEAIKSGNQEINPFIQLYSKDGTGKIVKGEEFDLAEYLDLPANNKPNKDGVSRGDVLFSYQQNKRAMTVAMALLAKENQSGATLDTEALRLMFKDRMVTDVRHELARLDERLATADLKGWGWTGGEDATRNAVRFAIYKDFKRAVDQEAIALEKKPNAGIDDMNAAIDRLQTYLDQNIEQFVKLADRPDLKAVYAEFTAKGCDASKILDWRVIRQDMQSSMNAPAKNPQMDQKAFENAQKKAA